MSETVISAQGVGKSYQLGVRTGHRTFRDAVSDAMRAPLRALRALGRRAEAPENRTHWALHDVSFDIRRGEVVGVIGRNGAGKSTLLKILSRITEPTNGAIEIHGRIGSLLEVGTGFHPELSGRENIFLNGAILGMKRTEIQRRFDEIVAFAEVEKFLDTPVRHYSSGMYMRLAFSVAAHLEPEILIVDEVLAVGDAEFQKKCLGRMEEIGRGGRTVIFVSHNMSAVQRMCTSGMFLERGAIRYVGDIQETVRSYVASLPDAAAALQSRSGGKVRFLNFRITDERGEARREFFMGETVCVEMTVQLFQRVESPILCIEIRDEMQECFAHILNVDDGLQLKDLPVGKAINVRVEIPRVFFTPSRYFFSFWAGEDAYTDSDYVRDALSIELFQGETLRRATTYPKLAKLYMPTSWEILL
jgi:lipopolysaccharide transport system ATP-binding protein